MTVVGIFMKVLERVKARVDLSMDDMFALESQNNIKQQN